MRTMLCLAALPLLLAASWWPAHAQSGAPPASPPPAVRVGQAAPDFTLPYLVAKPDGGFDTRQVSLSSFKGKQNVVLAFFPAAFSPG
jgi:ABC-type nitrate/sulfonate/bicarbonate transport system substrate-binding protein